MASLTEPGRSDLPRTLAADLAGYADQPGERVRLSGWIHRRRRLSGLTFVVIRDRSGLAQVVVRDPVALEAVEGLTEESAVE
ncbi:MAG TPA: OB-fold nucleic acid binding domain-containing protein, partial [Nocardioidaceae bacterium]|nr:OB-fold nucleic acid binding domain-containing protein [Nocardioidaceae bacterium]